MRGDNITVCTRKPENQKQNRSGRIITKLFRYEEKHKTSTMSFIFNTDSIQDEIGTNVIM